MTRAIVVELETKVREGYFNQEKALVEAFSVKYQRTFV